MSFGRKDYEFLKEIGLGPRNLGCYVNGVWQGNGPVVSSVNPADNQVCFSQQMNLVVFFIVSVLMLRSFSVSHAVFPPSFFFTF